jgi:hypothetical protein
MFQKKRFNIALSLLAFMFFMYADAASAAATLSDLATNVTNSSQTIAKMGKVVAALVGFILVLTGVNGIIQAKKQQQSLGMPILTLIVGAGLLSAVAITSISTSSLLGNDTSGISALGL